MDVKTELRRAQTIIDTAKAAGRDLTPEEAATVSGVIEQAKAARSNKPTAEQFAKGAALREKLDALAGDDSGTGESGHLSFRTLSTDLARGMKAFGAGAGVKGLVPAGETTVAIPVINTDPFAGDVEFERAPRLLDVLPVVTGRPSHYDALKQVHVEDAGGAAVVAPGDTKPTRRLKIERVGARLRVVAVLSEPVDKYVLEDGANLQAWVTSELGEAIQVALEDEILNGDGTGEHFTGLANTSGIQTQAFTTDRITTIAAALSKLEGLSIAPSVIALSPADALGLATTRNTSGAFDLGGAIDPAARQAWGTPYVVVPGLDTGTGYVIGNGAVSLSTDGAGIRAEWGTPGETFTKNQLVARVEGRFNLDVFKPHGVVQMTLEG